MSYKWPRLIYRSHVHTRRRAHRFTLTHTHTQTRERTHTRAHTHTHPHTQGHTYTDKHINPAKINYYVNTFNKCFIIIKIKYLKILNEIAKYNVHLYEQMLFRANIDNLDHQKASGPDGIHVIVLKKCAPEIGPVLSASCFPARRKSFSLGSVFK